MPPCALNHFFEEKKYNSYIKDVNKNQINKTMKSIIFLILSFPEKKNQSLYKEKGHSVGTRLGYTDAQGALVVHAMSSITPSQYFCELIDVCYQKLSTFTDYKNPAK